MSDLEQIQHLARDLLQRTAPAERRALLRRIAGEVRKSQSTRIGRQEQPDGSPFAARKQRATGGSRVRDRKMFRKLRMAKYLKAGSTGDEAWIGFSGRGAAVARVHQDGLDDSPTRGAKKVRYAKRVLLGLTAAESERALEIVLDYVTRGN